jgi:hypothetical protein
MQLNPLVPAEEKPRLRRSLMAASCALLSATGVAHADSGDWQVDSALLYYKESDGRVQAIEPVVSLRRDFGEEHVLGLKFTFDSLTGGSPNGAIPSTRLQTFAAPSGRSLSSSAVPVTYTTASGRTVRQLETPTLYTTLPGQMPLDSTFRDQRVAADASWSQPLGEASKLSVGAGLSDEHDWLAATANAGLSRDFNSRNTTLSLGVNGEYDSIKPVGGTPIALSDYTLFQKLGKESRSSVGGQVGLTQVLSRSWLMRFNLNYDRSSGYETDPYKIVSMVDSAGSVTGYRYENRPDQRARKSVYVESRVALRADDALSLSYRRLQDDWGIHSDTVDVKYRWALNDDSYIEPHLRWYRQTAADFYHLYLGSTTALPAYVSADPRLAAFTAPTVGFKYARTGPDDSELSVRLEYYKQTGKDVQQGPGALAGLDLYQGVKALMLQVGWRFGL